MWLNRVLVYNLRIASNTSSRLYRPLLRCRRRWFQAYMSYTVATAAYVTCLNNLPMQSQCLPHWSSFQSTIPCNQGGWDIIKTQEIVCNSWLSKHWHYVLLNDLFVITAILPTTGIVCCSALQIPVISVSSKCPISCLIIGSSCCFPWWTLGEQQASKSDQLD